MDVLTGTREFPHQYGRTPPTLAAHPLPPMRTEPHTAKRESSTSTSSNAVTATGPQEADVAMNTRLSAALLPKGFRGRGGAPHAHRGNMTNSNAGLAAAARLTDFLKGIMGAATGDRAAVAALESKLEGKLIHLDNLATCWQTEAQTAGSRTGAARAAGNPARLGLSGKRCKKMVSSAASRIVLHPSLYECGTKEAHPYQSGTTTAAAVHRNTGCEVYSVQYTW